MERKLNVMFFRLTVSFNNKDCLRLHDEDFV